MDAPWRLTRSLQLVFDRCEADTACRTAFPTLEEDFYAVLDSLEERPVALPMSDTTRFPDGRIVIDGRLFASGVFQGLYDRLFIPVLPLAIRETRAGNVDVLTALADGIAEDPHRSSWGLNRAIECYERVPFNPPEMIEAERARYPRLRAWYAPAGADVAVCDAWHDERADSSAIAPVESDGATLVLAGEFDPITPPAYGRLAAETLPNSTFVEARGLGHGVAPLDASGAHALFTRRRGLPGLRAAGEPLRSDVMPSALGSTFPPASAADGPRLCSAGPGTGVKCSPGIEWATSEPAEFTVRFSVVGRWARG